MARGFFFSSCPTCTSTRAGQRSACDRVAHMPAVEGIKDWPRSGQRRNGNWLGARVRGRPRIAERCGAGNGGGRDTAAPGRHRAETMWPEYCGRHSADPRVSRAPGCGGTAEEQPMRGGWESSELQGMLQET
jgi:hypothetical protein